MSWRKGDAASRPMKPKQHYVTSCSAAFAIPGDLMTTTGGYLYDRRLLLELRAQEREVTHIALAATYPNPTPADNLDAAERLAAVPASCPVIIDGLAMGAMDRAVLSDITAPIVALVHHPLAEESGLDPARRAELYEIERDNLALAAHVIVPSPHTARLLISDYGVAPERISIARPGTDQPPGRAAKADPPLILSVGIQVPRKGHDVLLRALATLADRPWQAVIAGPAIADTYTESLKHLVSELRLSGRVRIAGRVAEDQLTRLYGQASLFALATRYEGYGIVFNEAMAHGLPIVSCAVGAVPDTVAPGAGRLVPPDDPDAFAAALAQLLDDTQARSAMAMASAAAGASLTGWEDTARCVANVLDRVAVHV